MLKKHFMRNTIVFLISYIIILNFYTLKVYAIAPYSTERADGGGGSSTITSSDPSENPDYYHPKTLSPEEPEVQEKAGKILGYINNIGIVVSIITLVIIGIKYMLGSIDEKAEYKKTMIYYMLGALLLFSATTIPNILYKLTTGLSSSI